MFVHNEKTNTKIQIKWYRYNSGDWICADGTVLKNESNRKGPSSNGFWKSAVLFSVMDMDP